MVRVEIDLKAVTPAFIHGEPQGVAEFRVSSLRGMLRYWTRALWGAHASNLQALFKKESDLWGRTDLSSRVRIWSKNGLPKSDARSSLLPHYDQRASRSKALMPGTLLTLIVESREPSFLETALRILRLAFVLGGLGQRSRRGAGSFEIKDVRGIDDESLRKSPPRSPQPLADWIRAMIRAIQGNHARSAPHSPHAFPVLCTQESCSVIRVRSVDKGNEQDVRSEIMEDLRGYKSPVWGLPYIKTKQKQGDQPVTGRWASPAHFRVLPAEKGFLEVLTVMKSSFPDRIPRPSWAEVDRYVNSFGGYRAWP